MTLSQVATLGIEIDASGHWESFVTHLIREKQGTRERKTVNGIEEERESARSRLGSDRAKLCIRRR